MEYTAKDKRLYLRLGDRVMHLWHEEWGEGAVVEERTSIVPGGTCLVRLLFEDGQQRTFNNDLDNEQCCYFFGVRRIQAFDPFEPRGAESPARRRVSAGPVRIPVRVEDENEEEAPAPRAPTRRRSRALPAPEPTQEPGPQPKPRRRSTRK